MRRYRLLSLAAIALAAAALSGCRRDAAAGPHQGLGDPARGKRLVRQYGCGTCHEIPGVNGAISTVGPPLHRFAKRVYAGGRLNAPSNLVEFLLDPPAVDPATPMPRVGLDEAEARDVAAFLYTLD